MPAKSEKPPQTKKAPGPAKNRRVRAKKPEKQLPTHLELLRPFIGMIKDGPRDLAENHKLYASGAKKWK